mgnify:CR=1 FL=1
MGRQANEVMQVEAELRAPMGSAQLVRFCFDNPIDLLTRENDSYRLDLCLSPRPSNSRACFPDRWNERRFERIGNLFLLPAGEVMRARSDGCCEQTSLVCQLQPETMKEWFDGDLCWTDRRLMAGLDIRDANIQHLLFRLIQEARQPGFASEILVELLVAQLAIELTRYCTEVGKTASTGGLSAWRLRLIDERLEELGQAPTLTELAELCRLSVRQLTRGFRASRDCSIGDYVANSRMKQAKQLLATDQSVKSIAYALGFSSPSSFCYAFRRDTGETPGQYRQRLLSTH